MTSTRRLSPICFVLSVLCFFLTFSTVSCDDRPLARVSGVELAKGTTIRASRGGLFDTGRSERVPASKPVIVALIAAIVAAGAAIRGRARGAQLLVVALGFVGSAALLVFRSDAVTDVASRSMGMLTVHFREGFWGALLLMVAGTVAALHAATATAWPSGYPARDAAEPAWPGASP